MISIRTGVLPAVNLPPGSASGSATPLSGLLGSGLLGLTDATSNVASGAAAAGGAAGACADAAVAASRMTSAKPCVEWIVFISTFSFSTEISLRMANAAERPGRQDAHRQWHQHRAQHPHEIRRGHAGKLHAG